MSSDPRVGLKLDSKERTDESRGGTEISASSS
jgi:hypothetical protein